jgi:hypothetical protein
MAHIAHKIRKLADPQTKGFRGPIRAPRQRSKGIMARTDRSRDDPEDSTIPAEETMYRVYLRGPLRFRIQGFGNLVCDGPGRMPSVTQMQNNTQYISWRAPVAARKANLCF